MAKKRLPNFASRLFFDGFQRLNVQIKFIGTMIHHKYHVFVVVQNRHFQEGQKSSAAAGLTLLSSAVFLSIMEPRVHTVSNPAMITQQPAVASLTRMENIELVNVTNISIDDHTSGQSSHHPLRTLFPYLEEPLKGSFQYSLCESCCACSGICFCSWMMNCVPIGHLAEKMGFCLNFNKIVFGIVFLSILEFACYTFKKSRPASFIIFVLHSCIVVVSLVQIRKLIRNRYRIPGSSFIDFWTIVCCLPCSIMQLVSQIWIKPEETPGCSWDKSAGHMP